MIKKLICLLIICAVALTATGCSLFNSLLNEFDDYLAGSEFAIDGKLFQSDFENILSLVTENGNGAYIMDDRDYKLYNCYYDDDADYISQEIPTTQAERESIKNIICNSNNLGKYIHITHIVVNDDYVYFFDSDTGRGVVYTEDIRSTIKIINRDTDHFSYTYLSPCWYKIFD